MPEPQAQGKTRKRSYAAGFPMKDAQAAVLVRVLTIENPDAAAERVGDYVEITGDLNEQAKTLRIDSLKLLDKGRAMCGVPRKKA